MPDYSKGKIYTIRCLSDPNHIYVGSTTQPLSKRWGEHKGMSKRKENRLIYSTINNDWTDWYIELYEEYPCENKEQLGKREGEIIREIGTLNKQIVGRTKDEWNNENADKMKKYFKEYYKDNYDKKKKQNKEYQENNADMIKKQKKEYREKNASIIKEKKREYYENNTNRMKERMKEYRQLNVDKIKEKKREYYQRKKLEKQTISNLN